MHHRRLALLHLRVIEEPHRRGVDDDAVARRVGKDELRRNDDFAILARQPWIYAGIGAHDFFVAHIEAARDVGERVVLGGERLLHHADDVGGGIDLEAMRRHGLGKCGYGVCRFLSVAFRSPLGPITQK
jgi:hypothetical protein